MDPSPPDGKEQLPSLLAFEYPAFISNANVDAFLTHLAQAGVMVSGNLHQKVMVDGVDTNLTAAVGQRDKFRMGISRAQVMDWPLDEVQQSAKLALFKHAIESALYAP